MTVLIADNRDTPGKKFSSAQNLDALMEELVVADASYASAKGRVDDR